MKPSPFASWPKAATAQTVLSQPFDNGVLQCEDSLKDLFEMVRGQPWLEFWRELREKHKDGHFAAAKIIYGSAGRSRDVSREHPLNEGETL